MFSNLFKYLNPLLIVSFIFLLNSCGGGLKLPGGDARTVPVNADDRVAKNLAEGKGFTLNEAMKKNKGRGGDFQFATSNELWRASLDALDFMPLASVNYSGGIIITDWYSNTQNTENIKISIRFLSNDIKSENLKVTVHQRVCKNSVNCKIDLLENSNIKEELHRTILRKASLIEKDQKNKKQ